MEQQPPSPGSPRGKKEAKTPDEAYPQGRKTLGNEKTKNSTSKKEGVRAYPKGKPLPNSHSNPQKLLLPVSKILRIFEKGKRVWDSCYTLLYSKQVH